MLILWIIAGLIGCMLISTTDVEVQSNANESALSKFIGVAVLSVVGGAIWLGFTLLVLLFCPHGGFFAKRTNKAKKQVEPAPFFAKAYEERDALLAPSKPKPKPAPAPKTEKPAESKYEAPRPIVVQPKPRPLSPMQAKVITQESLKARVRAQAIEISRANRAKKERVWAEKWESAMISGAGRAWRRGLVVAPYAELKEPLPPVCVMTGETSIDKLHVDHKIPLAGGGSHTKRNLQVLRADLNLAKGAKVVI